MHPPAQQNDLADQFTATTGHPLNQSQISKILSPHYDYLDDTYTRKEKQALKEKSRSSIGNQPDLEGALFEQQQRIEQRKAIMTGDILKTKARELWDALLQYDNIEIARFSNSWLDNFKTRYKIKEYIQHREAGSVATDNLENITQIEKIRQLCTEYEPRNILNIDETGLNWKRTPDCTLATKSYSGTKKIGRAHV